MVNQAVSRGVLVSRLGSLISSLHGIVYQSPNKNGVKERFAIFAWRIEQDKVL
jgi:hypothetical protein